MADPYAENVAGYVLHRLDRGVEMLSVQCESPIEVGFLRALMGLWLFDRRIKFDALPVLPLETEWTARVFLQHEVGDLRLDFAIHVTAQEGGRALSAWIAVECDGHDFHEKTKEQVARDKARDRSITSQGYRIFRFSGSEIYRDNVLCAQQVVNFAAQIVDEWRDA